MIIIDREGCIGCGACEALCPHNFKLDEEGKAIVAASELAPCAQEAAESCPTNAIKID